MFSKAQRNDVIFRPHFKTHQSLEIGRWFKELGVDKITVSSLDMAEYFAPEWKDITVAFPVNILQIKTINSLVAIIRLNLLIESVETIDFLNENLTGEVGFFIKIDSGYHRTGLAPGETQKIDEILSLSRNCKLLKFRGFLAHAGHSYKCRSKEEILEIHENSVSAIASLTDRYVDQFPDLIISVGDTPTCSVAEDFSMVDEIRPGNFVFYDLVQNQIGACDLDQIAVGLACPIVAIHDERNVIVIYGGGVHFSKERLEHENFGSIYGLVAENKGNGWGEIIPEMYVRNLSQEHGIIAVPESEISNYKIGDVLMILPVHSCMTADLVSHYQTTSGKMIERI